MTGLPKTTVELDPSVLATPFQVQTRWHVLTGAACTGKTTLINALSGMGFRVLQEGARQYFEVEQAKGKTIADLRRDDATLQREIARIQLQLEGSLDPDEVAFLDRGLPDSLAFFRLFGMDPNVLLPDCLRRRYAGVFLLDRLPFLRQQTFGPEDDASSDFLNEWLRRDYLALGYAVVRVPVLPPEQRVRFILERTAG